MHKAWRTLSIALGFGVVTQALFWDAPFGLNVVLFALIALGASYAIRRPSRIGIALSIFAVIAAGSIAFRASEWSLVLGLPSAIAIGITVLAAPSSIADVPWAIGRLFRGLPAGTADAARTIPGAVGNDARPFVVRGLLGVGLGVPIAGVFGGLLASDESFRGAVSAGAERVGTIGGFAIASIVTAFVALAIALSVRALRAKGIAMPILGPYRHDPDAIPAAPTARPTLSIFTWGVVLAQVAFVFLIFAVANAKHLFGGVAMIHADRSLTYASYLHSGFAELVIASSASVALVAIGHALVTPFGETVVRGGKALAALEIAVLGLATLTLVSCAQRLFIYEDAYGATYKRLGVLVVGLVVLAVLAATAIKCARRGWNGWGGTAIAGVLGVLAIASVYDADKHIARRNLDRFGGGAPLDVDYLASLGPDACGFADHPALRDHPEMRQRLHDSWAAHDEGWRSRRGVVRCR